MTPTQAAVAIVVICIVMIVTCIGVMIADHNKQKRK